MDAPSGQIGGLSHASPGRDFHLLQRSITMTTHTANGKATSPRKAAKPRAAKTAKASPDQPPKTPQPGRDAHGKFQRGNTGGVGNPYARQVAILRRELMETTSPTDIRNIGLKLKALALEGNVQ